MLATGQHRLDLDGLGFDDVDRIVMDCPGQRDPHRHVQKVARAVAVALADPPRLLVVQGDTSSALGGALAGFAANIPVAHVEAGLRTHDPAMPWPEEEYRVAIDARTALLFAPTKGNAANLVAEGAPGAIHVTGNTGIDALLVSLARLPPAPPRAPGPLRLLVTCHRRENWGAGLRSVAAAIARLVGEHDVNASVVLHTNPNVLGSMCNLFAGMRGVELVSPLPPGEMIERMRRTDIILSDSGGVQEEAPVLGVPLLVLREKTERPEGVASGNMVLVGTDPVRIRDAVLLLMDPGERARMSRPAFPFGDGDAAPRIAGLIEEYLERDAAADLAERRA